VRVRTYGFPGCFTRPPGTSTRHHPHEPTTSKPVVPGDAYKPSLAFGGGAISRSGMSQKPSPEVGTRRRARGAAPPGVSSGAQKSDAVPGRSRNLLGRNPKARPRRWRGLTPHWPRSLRLGSASARNVTSRFWECNGRRDAERAVWEESREAAPSRCGEHPSRSPGHHRAYWCAPGAGSPGDAVRRRLAVLPQ
jgi:hypothetical protein